MENKVISKEYVEKNYIHKDVIIKKIEEYQNMIKKLNSKSDIERIKAINERLIAFQEILLMEDK